MITRLFKGALGLLVGFWVLSVFIRWGMSLEELKALIAFGMASAAYLSYRLLKGCIRRGG